MTDDTPRRVFLVDDDEHVRISLSRSLRLRGYEVEAFSTAEDFLGTFDAQPEGCLLLDYGMPGMNGLELQEALVKKGFRIPIIFITGHGGVPESVRAMKMGAVDFLEKPFVQADLLTRIEEALAQDAAGRAARARSAAIRARFESLTEREQEIAVQMVRSPATSSSKDIARILEISPRTVDHHRARILDKMAVGSVAELVESVLSTDVLDD